METRKALIPEKTQRGSSSIEYSLLLSFSLLVIVAVAPEIVPKTKWQFVRYLHALRGVGTESSTECDELCLQAIRDRGDEDGGNSNHGPWDSDNGDKKP